MFLLWFAFVAGCGGGDGRDSDEREILKVMKQGREALLRGDARAACRLLTPHGRKRALGYQVDFLPEGTEVPSNDPRAPQTCEEIFRAEYRMEHLPNVDQSWTPDLKRVRFKVDRIAKDDHEAKVLLLVEKPYGPKVTFRLREIPGIGWRVDDSDAVAQGY